jgi:AcrR family transcriptional regulator
MNQPAPSLSVRAEPVQQRSAERITNLLDAAADLIDEQGIDGLTTSDVATRSVGVVYRYFPNIQSLLRALAARNMERFTARITEAMAGPDTGWLTALDDVIDAYVDLTRTEPGFRALRFGDIIDERFIQPDVSNNTLISRSFNDLLVSRYGIEPSEELSFDLEVLVEIADSLLHRAFLYEREGDDRFIAKLRVLIREYLAPYQARAQQ